MVRCAYLHLPILSVRGRADMGSHTHSNPMLFVSLPLHLRVAFLPWAPVRLKSLKSLVPVIEPKTFADHLRRRRRELCLRQLDAANLIGVDEGTYWCWERGPAVPRASSWAGVVRSAELNQERKEVAAELMAEPPSTEVVALHPTVLARYEQQLGQLQHGLSRGTSAGDSESS